MAKKKKVGKIYYVCNRTACAKCSSDCQHTCNIAHAKNFVPADIDGNYPAKANKAAIFIERTEEMPYARPAQPLSVVELMCLEMGDWAWIEERGGGAYWKVIVPYAENSLEIGKFFGTYKTMKRFRYEDYGKTWIAYKSKEYMKLSTGAVIGVDLATGADKTVVAQYRKSRFSVYCNKIKNFFRRQKNVNKTNNTNTHRPLSKYGTNQS